MPLTTFAPNKIYYYVICTLAFFVLMWGVIDLTSSTLNLFILNPVASQPEMMPGDGMSSDEMGGTIKAPMVEDYYQRRMMMDRFGDSLARVLISGIIFAYARFRIYKLEGGA